MSEPVGGKCCRTLPLDPVSNRYKCGSASPVRYLISVTSAAPRFQRGASNFSNPDTNAARRSEPDRNRDRNQMGTGSELDRNRISVLDAARRLWLDLDAARRRLDVVCSWI